MNDSRAYNSPSREQGKSETREAIIAAVVTVILEQGIHAFTMQNVAEAAGVSHRTVYRHFESREALLEGLQQWLQERAVRAGLSPPEDASKFVDFVGPLFEEFFRFGDAMRASVIAATALGYQTQQQRDTLGMIERPLALRFPRLPASELHEAAAALRFTVSRYSWYVLAVDLQLTAEEAARSVTSLVRALFRDLERRNAARSKGPESSPGKSSKRRTKPEVRS